MTDTSATDVNPYRSPAYQDDIAIAQRAHGRDAKSWRLLRGTLLVIVLAAMAFFLFVLSILTVTWVRGQLFPESWFVFVSFGTVLACIASAAIALFGIATRRHQVAFVAAVVLCAFCFCFFCLVVLFSP